MPTPAEAFGLIELRAGRIIRADPNPKARQPAYTLSIDFGPLGIRQSSAQLCALYSPEDLVGRLIVAACNLGTRNIAGVESQVLVLGVPDEQNRVVLLSVERDVPLGVQVF